MNLYIHRVKMILRICTKQRLLILFIGLILIVSFIYFYFNYVQENYNSAQLSTDRCFTELTSVKYQLNGNWKYASYFKFIQISLFSTCNILLANKHTHFISVVTEYKNRIDKLLTETEKQHKLDKERFRDIMESCVAMKQQSMICQVFTVSLLTS